MARLVIAFQTNSSNLFLMITTASGLISKSAQTESENQDIGFDESNQNTKFC